MEVKVSGEKTENISAHLTGAGGRIILNRCGRIADKFNGYIGVGYHFFEINQIEESVIGRSSGNINYSLSINDSKFGYRSFLLHTGVEWKLQSRFGWSLFCNLSKADDIEVIAEIMEDDMLGGFTEKQMTIQKFSYPAIHIETTLALYF